MPRCPNPHCQTDYPQGTRQCTRSTCRCLLPEAVIAGRYRVETLIGMGGMGAVYRASDTFEVQQVALKVLSLIFSNMDTETAVERFRREARYAHQLNHPNIVPVLNFGQDGDLLYITMPLITGGTLKALLKPEYPLPVTESQRYLNDLAAAIDAIHNHPQQIVHRDIKPSNLLIHQDDGRLMVADFGIARAMQAEKPLTQRGWALGTENYIAPEQTQGKAEPVSDIYSMGIVAYQLFTGLLPYQALVRNRARGLPPPSALNVVLPPSVDAVVMHAMEVEPEKRFQSGKAFTEALQKALTIGDIWSEPTVSELTVTMATTSNANVIVRTIIPENPCAHCGGENRSTSLFCRHCGRALKGASPMDTEVCQVGYLSDIGRQARDNEDMLLIVQGLTANLPPPPRPFGLFAVADGLSGQQGKNAGGHEASRLAVETIADILLPLISSSATASAHSTSGTPARGTQPVRTMPKQVEPALEQWLRDGVRQANQVIYHCNADYETEMGSTLTAALLYKRRAYIASVGDSRAYHYQPQQGLRCLTRDHSLAANLVEADLLKADEIATSPKRHQLYRQLGKNYHVTIDLFQYPIEPNDTILLCSDGLWHMLPDERIQELLTRTEDPQHAATLLVEAANNAGGEGNISAIVVRVQ